MRPYRTPLHLLAPAKVNLTLHLRGQRSDGYHLLDSLVVFPRIGDRVRVEPAESLSLDISGPFAGALAGQQSPTAPMNAASENADPTPALPEAGSRGSPPAPAGGVITAAMGAGAGDRGAAEQASADCSAQHGAGEPSGAKASRRADPDADNLMLRAARALAAHRGRSAAVALHLEKNLPVASGLGGGSSDAAAVLSLLAGLWQVEIPETLALSLGADVPVCLRAPHPIRMQGIGEQLAPSPALPGFWMVLVNPRVAVTTAEVFAFVADRNPPKAPEPPKRGFRDFSTFTSWLATQRNDLEEPASRLCPEIGQVLAALNDAPLARMSGSGASCFALLPDRHEAESLAARLKATHPGWWVTAAEVTAGA